MSTQQSALGPRSSRRFRPSLTLAWLAVLALPLGGCAADLRNASSGKIGCAPDRISIEDDSVGFASRTWTAVCGGKRYFCSSAANDVGCTLASGANQAGDDSSPEKPVDRS